MLVARRRLRRQYGGGGGSAAAVPAGGVGGGWQWRWQLRCGGGGSKAAVAAARRQWHLAASVEAGRNTFGTCFGETGLKIRPDVFRHDNCEQKKHVLLCKMSPASHFFLFEKGEKNNK